MRFFAGRRAFGATRARRRRLSGDRRASTLRRCACAVRLARADGAACSLANDPNCDLGQICVAARNAAAAPLLGASDGVVRGDLRWSGREGGRRGALYLRVG